MGGVGKTTIPNNPGEGNPRNRAHNRKTMGRNRKNTSRTRNNGTRAKINPHLTYLRQTSLLYKTMTRNKSIQQWRIQDYTENEVYQTLKRLENNKSHGTDGIPGEAYRVLAPYVTKPIASILNQIKKGNIPRENGKIGGGQYPTYTNKQKRRNTRLQQLQANVLNANNQQNMAKHNRQEAHFDTTNPDKKQPIRLQTRPVANWRNR